MSKREHGSSQQSNRGQKAWSQIWEQRGASEGNGIIQTVLNQNNQGRPTSVPRGIGESIIPPDLAAQIAQANAANSKK